MKEIKLKNDRVALVDDSDYENLVKYKWYERKGKCNSYAVATIKVDGKRKETTMHKMLTGAKMTDHIDHNGLNNQRANLRPCTSKENNRNRIPRKNKAIKYKGVSKMLNRFTANIRGNERKVSMGSFTTAEEAAIAYDSAARHFFGEFAFVNFPEINAPYIPYEAYSYMKGYYFNKAKNKFYARMTVDGKIICIGTYDTEQEARKAYLDAKSGAIPIKFSKPLTLACGVNKIYNRYSVRFRHKGKYVKVGNYDTFDEARSAYVSAKRKLGKKITESQFAK